MTPTSSPTIASLNPVQNAVPNQPAAPRPTLTAEQLSEYHRSGYLVLRNVFRREEIEQLSVAADALLGQTALIDVQNIRCRWQDHVDTGACLFECFDPVIDLCPLVGQFAHDPRILGPLAGVYGEAACLFKDKLIFKPPGAKGYGLHQDYISWQNFPRTFVTVLVAIDAAADENGATEVFPGFHHGGHLSADDGMYHELPLTAVDLSRGVRLDLQPGDIAFFGCFTPHRSAPNRTEGWRRQLYLSYNAHSDGGPRRAAHYAEFHTWLRERYAEYGKHNVYFR